ncbi:hypothetical protein BKA82DRAFT_1005925 [Pisolithus tinctorius]|uniref:Uncharacterized protein n=1 Tax=Pisolithus tinctorius Marx 270 TaxID=870435 RepID=A0A0C3NQN3_PISTI|nr:hypothetical protein BKA82DRAFT_1005925 [Pisolithus tinctorius]KIN97623.1 hypothetical protein M404DRAFT_1005925 [Pisolithus tinctorius Marx 270]
MGERHEDRPLCIIVSMLGNHSINVSPSALPSVNSESSGTFVSSIGFKLYALYYAGQTQDSNYICLVVFVRASAFCPGSTTKLDDTRE